LIEGFKTFCVRGWHRADDVEPVFESLAGGLAHMLVLDCCILAMVIVTKSLDEKVKDSSFLKWISCIFQD